MADKVKKSITLKLSHYEVRGVADVSPWGGGRGSIDMKPFNVASIDNGLIKAGINDNGFGVQSINGAVCDVYAVYSDNDGDGYPATAKKFVETVIVGNVCDEVLAAAI